MYCVPGHNTNRDRLRQKQPKITLYLGSDHKLCHRIMCGPLTAIDVLLSCSDPPPVILPSTTPVGMVLTVTVPILMCSPKNGPIRYVTMGGAKQVVGGASALWPKILV